MTDEKYFPFEQLEVYRLAVTFAAEVYRVTETFPAAERFGLTNQIRRAATSVSLNIAEGRGRGYDKEFSRFLLIARRSLFEVIAASQVGETLGYVLAEQLASLREKAHELTTKLMSLTKKLSAQSS